MGAALHQVWQQSSPVRDDRAGAATYLLFSDLMVSMRATFSACSLSRSVCSDSSCTRRQQRCK